jgi:raffinose/stachyose/melibiose transport system permease protein
VKGRAAWRALYLVIALVLCLPLYVFPLAYLLNVSLQSGHQFLANPMTVAHPLTLSNYPAAWVEGTMSTYFLNSVIYAGSATVVSLLMAVFIAFPIARGYFRFTGRLYSLFLIGFFLPLSLIPLFIEAQALGLYNDRIGYILLHLQAGLTLGVLFFVGYFASIPRELDESAQLDGCGYLRYIFRIIIPLAKPALATVGIYTAVAVWNDLIGPVVFLSSNSLYPLTRGLFAFYGQYSNEWTLLAAGVFLVALPLIVAFLFVQRYLIQGAVAGSIKL